jgi:hypothetical protein
MNEHTLPELIDQYLLGTISPKDKLDLEQLMASDPIVAEQVKESQEAFKVIQHERNRILKEKLKEIDKDNPKKSALFPRLVLTVVICFVAILFFVLLVSGYNNPSSIAQRYFENKPMPEVGISSRPDLEETWSKANEAFLKKEYEKAMLLYASWIEEAGEAEVYIAEWNFLLAQLGLQGSTIAWKSTFTSFLNGAPEPWKSKGNELLKLVGSGPYGLFFHGLKSNLSALKPRLI